MARPIITEDIDDVITNNVPEYTEKAAENTDLVVEDVVFSDESTPAKAPAKPAVPAKPQTPVAEAPKETPAPAKAPAKPAAVKKETKAAPTGGVVTNASAIVVGEATADAMKEEAVVKAQEIEKANITTTAIVNDKEVQVNVIKTTEEQVDAEDLMPASSVNSDQAASTSCEFVVDATKFVDFLKSVAFDNLMEDAFIIINNGRLKCLTAEPIGQQVMSCNIYKDVDVRHNGTLIISKITKFLDVLKLFRGATKVTYAESKITLTSDKLNIELCGDAECYVRSYEAMKDLPVDMDNYTIGTTQFSKFDNFVITKSALASIWETLSTVKMDFCSFKTNPLNTKSITIEAADGRDSVRMTIDVANAKIINNGETKQSKYLKQLVNTIKGDKATIFLNERMIVVLVKNENIESLYTLLAPIE